MSKPSGYSSDEYNSEDEVVGPLVVDRNNMLADAIPGQIKNTKRRIAELLKISNLPQSYIDTVIAQKMTDNDFNPNEPNQQIKLNNLTTLLTKYQIAKLLQIDTTIDLSNIDAVIAQKMTENDIKINPNDTLENQLQLTELKGKLEEKLQEKKGGKKHKKSKRYRKSKKQRKTKTKRRLRRSYKYKYK